jgi:hypothetical protein
MFWYKRYALGLAYVLLLSSGYKRHYHIIKVPSLDTEVWLEAACENRGCPILCQARCTHNDTGGSMTFRLCEPYTLSPVPPVLQQQHWRLAAVQCSTLITGSVSKQLMC